MKYQYVEIQALLLVEKLLNDPAERDTCTLRELLNSLSARGEITILSIDNAANEIMIKWCGMTGCILYRADGNTWQMHT